MKWLSFCGLLFACLAGRFAHAADEPFAIAVDGQPRCVIAVAAAPSPAEQTAAVELQAILKEVTGAELPIHTCSEVARDARQIVVGPSMRLGELLPDIKLAAVGADGIVIRTVGNALVLAGPRPRMPGDHREWAVSFPLSGDLAPGNPWHVYVAARCDATAKDGRAMTMGIYDSAAKKSVAARTVTVDQAAGPDYRVFDLGTHTLSGSMYVWLAPPERPEEIQYVYVDRVFLIHEKK